MRGFVSIALRMKVNIESLNGVESIGNLSRHRTAPIVVKKGDTYQIRYVPAVSGESIAHAFQALLVERAQQAGLPVSEYSARGEFLKFTDEEIMKRGSVTPPADIDDVRRAEIDILLADIVCDVGGFLYAGKPPIKRTSRFQCGYMIPANDEVDTAAMEAQFHVRHAPSETKKGEKGETRYQIPYNVEVGSAVYTLSMNLDVTGIARPSTLYGKGAVREKELESQRKKRVETSFVALLDLLSSMSFGAKRSRFLPNIEVLSAIGSYSPNSSFVVSAGNSKNYISETLTRSQEYRGALKSILTEPEITLVAFDREDCTKGLEIQRVDSIEGLVKQIIEQAAKSK